MADHIVSFDAPRHHEHEHVARYRRRAYAATHLEAIELGHLPVEDHE
jgi:hypothetical protein